MSSAPRCAAKQFSTSAMPAVVISGTKLGLGGVRTHLFLLSGLLLDKGLRVHLYATGSQWNGGLLEQLRSKGARLHLPPKCIWNSPRLSLMYSGLTWPIGFPRLASSLYCIGAGRSHLLAHRLRSKRTISVNHEIVEPPDVNSPAGICAARLDTTVANSKKVAELMRGYWPGKPIRVIPFLTSSQPIPPPRSRPKPEKPLRVVYLGRLVEQKRPHELAKQWPKLTQHPALTAASLDIYGYDPEGSILREINTLVTQKNLGSQIRVRGEYQVRDLPAILDNSDLVVLPSLWEGLPLVLVETMALGVPFVATEAGGTAELGENNPDVKITSTRWEAFEKGLISMAEQLLTGRIEPRRLHAWAEQRYGFNVVSERWLCCLLEPRSFFQLQ